MDSNIRKRIDKLKEINGFKTDNDVIYAIFKYKKTRGETGRTKDFEYVEKSKGSFSQCFNGKRDFKLEDYLAIEYVLNTSMAYVIEGKGEMPDGFKPCGIRYAAFTDTRGNYEEIINEGVLNDSDEYDKMLIDYMIEYKSKNGFVYFAERDMLPLNSSGGTKYDMNCLRFGLNNNKKLLKVLCEVLPIDLLMKYFDGFLNYQDVVFSRIDEQNNTSFTDDVIAEAIKRDDLRSKLYGCKKINLDSYNRSIRLSNGKTLGEGLFVNYGLTAMIKYALTNKVDDEIRKELLYSAIKVNQDSFEHASIFSEEELKIDKYGFITNKYDQIYYGSIVVAPDICVETSDETEGLFDQLQKQVRDYHEYISNNSKISIFANEIFVDKSNNKAYYDFFKLMNDEKVEFIPVHKENGSNSKDLFEVSSSKKARPSNGTDGDLNEILSCIRKLDDISIKQLKGKTYYLVDPSIYMSDGKVSYIIPKNITISNKYSNLVRFINNDAMWSLYEINSRSKSKHFIHLIKSYGIVKEELEEFLQAYLILSEEQSSSTDKTSDRGKMIAFKALENKAWIEIYHDSIVKEF